MKPVIDAKRKALEILHAGVADIMSSAGWRKALEFRSRFYHYSFFNTSLILAQCADARLVAGYRKWQELGRQVRKGEKGIAILAPILKRDKEDPERRVIAGFRQVRVFDAQQTDGEPIPEAPQPQLLEGDNAAISAALARLEAYCAEQGLQLTRDLREGGARGVYRPLQRSIALQSGLSPLQELKTLTHEITHARLHDLSSERAQAELEAESCAFLVCHALGLDTGVYSFSYLAHWADSLDALIAAGDRASKAAADILHHLLPEQHDVDQLATLSTPPDERPTSRP